MDLGQTQKGQSVWLNISRRVTDSRVGDLSLKHNLTRSKFNEKITEAFYQE